MRTNSSGFRAVRCDWRRAMKAGAQRRRTVVRACAMTRTKLIDIIRVLTGGDMKIKLKKRVRFNFFGVGLSPLPSLFVTLFLPRRCFIRVPFIFLSSGSLSLSVLSVRECWHFGKRNYAQLIPVRCAWWREIWKDFRLILLNGNWSGNWLWRP